MKSRRLWFIVMLAALLGVAVVVGNGATRAPAVVGGTPPPDATAVWFCPGPPARLQSAAVVTFSNLGAAPADVVVTDLADKGETVRQVLTVPPQQVTTHQRKAFGPPGALTVETFGSRMVVEEGVAGTKFLETGMCATRATGHSLLAAGSTLRGVQDWLVLDNPYAADAKVDVTLRTGRGLRRPDALQNLDIARRSRYVAAIHSYVVREALVAIEVTARVGAVVSSQTLEYSSDAGTPGVASTLAALAPAEEWTFAGGTADSNSTTAVAIVNAGTTDAPVDVRVVTENNDALPPASFTVAEDTVASVQLGHCRAGAKPGSCISVPGGVRYSVEVRADPDAPVVAQIVGRYSDPGTVVGAVTAVGEAQPARQWVFGRSRVAALRSTKLSFVNPGAATVRVGIGLVYGGKVNRPRSLRDVVVKPGRQVTVIVAGDRRRFRDAAILVDASGPIYAERSIISTSGAVRSVGAAF